jgi:Zn-dependent hydrolases, including glyoxylases
VAFDRVPVRDGDVIDVSPFMRIRVIATPGHTFTHLSYALEAAGRPRAVFTGGSLLYGSTGRPDLLGAAHAAELAHAQYASAHRLAAELPEDADVYPTHGFGSFCSATQAAGPPPPPRPSAGRGGSTRRWSWLSSGTSASCWPGWMPTPPTMRTWGRRTRPALLART